MEEYAWVDGYYYRALNSHVDRVCPSCLLPYALINCTCSRCRIDYCQRCGYEWWYDRNKYRWSDVCIDCRAGED